MLKWVCVLFLIKHSSSWSFEYFKSRIVIVSVARSCVSVSGEREENPGQSVMEVKKNRSKTWKQSSTTAPLVVRNAKDIIIIISECSEKDKESHFSPILSLFCLMCSIRKYFSRLLFPNESFSASDDFVRCDDCAVRSLYRNKYCYCQESIFPRISKTALSLKRSRSSCCLRDFSYF